MGSSPMCIGMNDNACVCVRVCMCVCVCWCVFLLDDLFNSPAHTQALSLSLSLSLSLVCMYPFPCIAHTCYPNMTSFIVLPCVRFHSLTQTTQSFTHTHTFDSLTHTQRTCIHHALAHTVSLLRTGMSSALFSCKCERSVRGRDPVHWR